MREKTYKRTEFTTKELQKILKIKGKIYSICSNINGIIFEAEL